MSKAFVLMTAMPPTRGHLQLIRFADRLATDGTMVIVCTQPLEPMTTERVSALRAAVPVSVRVEQYDKTIEQNPAAPGFWPMWQRIMTSFGVMPDDYIVASEAYGQRLADITGAQFFPYDIDRLITPVKATLIRDDPLGHFADIIPEFQTDLRTTITVFGAESTGKTTLSRQLAQAVNGHWLFEYARPYLEQTVKEITPRSMQAIWRGQAALQRHAADLQDKPFVIQDTDLFSTVGYWQFPHWQDALGECPSELIREANELKSDLYIITPSNIPFEADPLRYGGNKREGSDAYWIELCERYELPYVVLHKAELAERLEEARRAALAVATLNVFRLTYDRHGL